MSSALFLLSRRNRIQAGELCKSQFMWVTDLCAQTQAVLKHVLSSSSNFVCSLTLGCKQRALRNVTHQHKRSASWKHCFSAENSAHGCAFVCPAGENVQPPVTQRCPWNKAQPPRPLGLPSFLGLLGLALFWDRVFLNKVRRWSRDQNRIESYFEVCHGHPVWSHMYMQNMGKAAVQKELDPAFGFLIQIQPLLYVVVANVANINYFILSLAMLSSGPPNTSSWSHETT